MKTVLIRARSGEYRAVIGSGLLRTIGSEVAQLVRGSKCAVIADENTAARFAKEVVESLQGSGFATSVITIPAGENSKSLAQAGDVCEQMAAARLDRSSFVVALGGGVVGDLAGFAAAIYQRGIPYVQVPTTLLAQVDSSIGGKTAVNTATGKNSLGAIHPPVLVLADVETLRTLPAREFKQGFAEIIKHGIIADAAIFELLEEVAQVCNLPSNTIANCKLASLVARNIGIKAEIVARDEQDVSGERAVLNFGHTVGHAIETAAGYGAMLHGEAVSLGIVVACEVSVRKAGLSEAERERVVSALAAFQLPTHLPADFPREAILPAMTSDKKFERGAVRFVVTQALGSAHLTSAITYDDLGDALRVIR